MSSWLQFNFFSFFASLNVTNAPRHIDTRSQKNSPDDEDVLISIPPFITLEWPQGSLQQQKEVTYKINT